MIKNTILPLAILTMINVGCGTEQKSLTDSKVRTQTTTVATTTGTTATAATASDTLWKTDYTLIRDLRKIISYRLDPADKPDSADRTIAGFKVIGEGKSLSDKQKNLLQFLALSPLSYNRKNVVYKKLFLPSVAFGFTLGNETIYLLVDLSTDEWALANDKELIQHQFNYCRRELLQLASDIYPNDEYFDYLIKKINDHE